MAFRILYRDEFLVAIDKPAGFQVHPPEDSRHRISDATNCLKILRDQLGQFVYPVHRLDRATSGVLLFGLSKPSASRLALGFKQQQIKKSYYCVVRGWTQESALIDHPLRSDSSEERLPAQTRFFRLAQLELPHPVGKYPQARYSLVRVLPLTGRMHQIRRHLGHLSHPLIGDTVYGDGVHNRLFREKYGIRALLLKAHEIEFLHPETGREMRLTSRWNAPWHQVFELFGVCPFWSDLR